MKQASNPELTVLEALDAVPAATVQDLVCQIEGSANNVARLTENQVRGALTHLRDKGDVIYHKRGKYGISVHGRQRFLNHLRVSNPKSPRVKAALKRKSFVLPVRIEALEDGSFLAICDSIQGCHAEGETVAEALDNIEDIAHVLLEVQKELGFGLPGGLEEQQPDRVLKAELLVQFPE